MLGAFFPTVNRHTLFAYVINTNRHRVLVKVERKRLGARLLQLCKTSSCVRHECYFGPQLFLISFHWSRNALCDKDVTWVYVTWVIHGSSSIFDHTMFVQNRIYCVTWVLLICYMGPRLFSSQLFIAPEMYSIGSTVWYCVACVWHRCYMGFYSF